MNYTQDIELILKGLCRDRDELSTKLTAIEKLIKRIKSGDFALNQQPKLLPASNDTIQQPETTLLFPSKQN